MSITTPAPTGRTDQRGKRSARADLPAFNAEAFSRWFRKWKDSEGLEWGQIADRAGVDRSTLHSLASGAPNSRGGSRLKQIPTDPRVNTLARVAYGLGLELGYVLSKAGLTSKHEGRWANFTSDERATIARALAEAGEVVSPTLQHLAEELHISLTNDDNNEGDE